MTDSSISVKPDLFKGLKFCLIDDGEIIDKVKGLLLEGGGTHNSYLSDMVTHVICDNPDNPGVSEAEELFEKPVLTSRWVFLSAKCSKLLPLSPFFPVKTHLFYGFVFCASQISVEDKKKLWAMVTFYGGLFELDFTKSCTHLVVGKPEGAKYEKAFHISEVKIITPDWVTDSIKNKSLCDEELYHPRLLILPQPTPPAMPSPDSPSLNSTLMTLDKINIEETAGQPSEDKILLQNISSQVKLPTLEDKVTDDILADLSAVDSKAHPNVQLLQSDPNLANRVAGLLLSSPQQANLIPKAQAPVQNVYQNQQLLHNQQLLQQGEQKLNQALQQIRAQQLQQQPQSPNRPLVTSQPQMIQQRIPQWQQQRMTLAQQQHLQQQLLQMQRLKQLQQQQQQLRNRQNLSPAQLAHLQHQHQAVTSQQIQQNKAPTHILQQQPAQNLLQKQANIQHGQVTIQQNLPQQQGQNLLHTQHLQPASNQGVPAQMHMQFQAQLRQQQQLQFQQQNLPKHQVQQLQQQLFKQQHLQHLQQQQQQQQAQLNQQRALAQSPNMPPSPLHLQQQNILQPSPRQSPLQHSPRQHSPQQPQSQQSTIQLQQHQQSPLSGQRSQTPLQQQVSVPLSPLQAQQIAIEKAQQSAAEKLQQTELIKAQLQQAGLERGAFQQSQQLRLQQSLDKSALSSTFEATHSQQNLLQNQQLQCSPGQQLHLQQASAQQLQQNRQVQLQKATLHSSQQSTSLSLQHASPKTDLQGNLQQQPAAQFSNQASQMHSIQKTSQIQGLQQLHQTGPLQRLQLQHLASVQLNQGASFQRIQQGTGIQRMQIQNSQLQLQPGQSLQQIQGTTLQQLQQGASQQVQLQHSPQLSQGSPVQQIQQVRMQQGSPAQVQLQQGSPAQFSQGSPVLLPQGSPAQQSPQIQGSPSSQHLQLQQGSPAQHLQLQQGSPAQHLQLSQGSPAQHATLHQSSSQIQSQNLSQPSQANQLQQATATLPSPQLHSQTDMQSVSAQQGQSQQASSQQAQQSQQHAIQHNSTQLSVLTAQLKQEPSLQQSQTISKPVSISQTSSTDSTQVNQTHVQIPVQATHIQQTSLQLPISVQQSSGQITSQQSQASSQNDLQLHYTSSIQMSSQQQNQVPVSHDLGQVSVQSTLRQASPIQMQINSVQSQIQKVQFQRTAQMVAQQNQMQQSSPQQVLLKQVSQNQLAQGLSVVQQGSSQGVNQQVNLHQTSVHQVQLQHVLHQARIQQLRQQQALLQQSITQTPNSTVQQGPATNLQHQVSLQHTQALHSPQVQNINQSPRQTLQSPQPAGQIQGTSQSPRLPSPLQHSQLQQLTLQQLQKTGVPQQVLQQSQLQQLQLQQAALQRARLQQSANASAQLIQQGQVVRPQQTAGQAQVVTKQIQIQQQISPQAQTPQPPSSPQLQQSTRFSHQLSPVVRPLQKQFTSNIANANQTPVHGQPPVQGLHQQQLLQQRQQVQQQLALQQLRQRQLQQQQQQLQTAPHSTQTVQQILSGQPPVMMKPPPQYPYDRQELQGQPRLQYPPHPRQLSPQQSPRPTWQQVPNQSPQFLRRSPGVSNPPASPQWQQPSPKDEMTSPSPSPGQVQKPVTWPQKQVLPSQETRDTATPAPATPSPVWSQNQQRDSSQSPQLIQWQQLKQMELRRQQLLQQQNQTSIAGQRPPSQNQLTVHSDIQVAQRVAISGQQHQTLAVPAQYQPQNAPSILSQTSPGSVNHSTPPAAQVTPKTKTALANLLNTRLQTTSRAVDATECNQTLVRTSQVISQPTHTASQRLSSENLALVHPSGPVAERIPTVPQVNFYGHDPKVNVPSEFCLAGCIFHVVDYSSSVETEKLEIWKKVIDKYGGRVENNYSSNCTHVICETQRNPLVRQAMREGKRCVTAFWLNDVLEKGSLRHPWFAHHFPTPFADDKPCKNQIITVTNFEPEERTVLKHMIELLGAKYTSYMTSHNSVLICKRKEGKKTLKAAEWRIPVVNAFWLQDLLFGHFDALKLPMAHKYQQFDLDSPFGIEYNLVPHLMAAWKVPVKLNEEQIKKCAEFTENKENVSNEGNEALEKDISKRELDDKKEPDAKKLRIESPTMDENIPLTTQNPPDSANKPSVLFTGIKNIKEYAKVVLQLGGRLAKSTTDCTHLVAEQCSRTSKFLCAIHVAKYVVTPAWITESEKQNQFVDEDTYILEDDENEKLFGFNMRKVLKRVDQSPLFENFVFYVTPGVFPKSDVLRLIIEAGGGIPVFKKAPSLRQIDAMEQNGQKFVIITCENDIHLCKMYLAKKICVQNVEFILTGSIRQELDFESFAYN